MANAMGDRFGVNLGNVLTTAQNLKANDQKMNAMNAAGEQANQARSFREAFIAAKTPEDQKAAFDMLVAVDPEGGKTFLESYSKMDEKARADIKRRNNRFGQYAHVVSQAENPEKAWNDVKRYMTPEEQEEWGEFSPLRVNLHLAQAREVEDMMELGDKLTIQGNEFKQENEVLDKKFKQEKELLGMKLDADKFVERMKAAGTRGLKASDVNAMYSQAAALFGGFYDPVTQKITGLDGEKPAKVQGLLTRAEALAAGGMELAGAVTQAAKEAGIKIPAGTTTVTETVTETTQNKAPKAAIDFLKANPQFADKFKEKYGYLP